MLNSKHQVVSTDFSMRVITTVPATSVVHIAPAVMGLRTGSVSRAGHHCIGARLNSGELLRL